MMAGEVGRPSSGSALAVAIKAVYSALAFGTAVLLARALGPAGYGAYAYAFALVMLLAIPVRYGFPTLVLRETAVASMRGDGAAMRGAWRWAVRWIVVLSAVIVAAAIAVAVAIAPRVDEHVAATFVAALPLLPLLALIAVAAAALRGLQRVGRGMTAEFITRPFILLVLAGLAALPGPPELDAPLAMTLHVLAAAAALLVAWIWLPGARPSSARPATPTAQARKWGAGVLPLAVVAGMQLIIMKTDIVMLGLWEDAATVGLYQVAVSGATAVIAGLGAVNLVLAPRFARLSAAGDRAGLQLAAASGARTVLWLALPIALPLIVFGEPLLRLVFGTDYTGAAWPLAVLCVGQLANAAFGSVAALLNMSGHERRTARGVAIAATLNVVLNLLLIPRFGMIGAATATAIGTIVWNGLLWRDARRLLGVDASALGSGQSRA